MTLLDAKIADKNIIDCVSGNSLISNRLIDMGFTHGTQITVNAFAYGSVLVQLRGYTVALGSDAARKVQLLR